MQYTEIKEMLEDEDLGLPVTYYSWPEKQAPQLPYLVWYLPGSENFAADDSVYKRIQTLNIELYTEVKDFLTEMDVEGLLYDYGMVWDKVETYIDSEKMYQVLYTMEVIIDA